MVNNILKAGTYHHHKGGEYTVFFTANTHNHNGDIDVVYFSHKYGTFNTRPLKKDSRNEDSWTDLIPWPDGKIRQRFIPDTEFVSIQPPLDSRQVKKVLDVLEKTPLHPSIAGGTAEVDVNGVVTISSKDGTPRLMMPVEVWNQLRNHKGT